MNAKSTLTTDVWNETLEWRAYEYKEQPTLASHARVVARQAESARSPEQDDLDYDPTEGSSARNLVLETKRGTLVDYLDHMELQMGKHIYHRNLVSSEHRSKLQYSRNARPMSVARDIDFSENGIIENADKKLQAEHWVTKQYTLFISIASFLSVDEWNNISGKLNDNAEVTVHGERCVNGQSREPANLDSFWATVKNHIGGDGDIYEVEDGDEKLH